MLTDKAKELLCAAAKTDGQDIEFYVARAIGSNSYSVVIGREFSPGSLTHRMYLEYVDAANELVSENFAEASLRLLGREHAFELTLEGYKYADSICE